MSKKAQVPPGVVLVADYVSEITLWIRDPHDPDRRIPIHPVVKSTLDLISGIATLKVSTTEGAAPALLRSLEEEFRHRKPYPGGDFAEYAAGQEPARWTTDECEWAELILAHGAKPALQLDPEAEI